MNLEPTYTYEKGKGWIARIAEILQLRDYDVFMEMRLPQIGEYYSYFSHYDDYYVSEDKTLKYDVVRREYKNHRLQDFGKFSEADQLYYRNQGYLDLEYNDTGSCIFMVLTKVSSTSRL